MSQPQSSSVRRYFPLADSFVEVQQFGEATAIFDAPGGLDGAGYRRLVIQMCMPQFASELVEQLTTLFPEDPGVAEDLLYALCIEVNPSLEINTVNLRSAPAEDQLEAEPQPRKEPLFADPLPHLALVARDLERRLKLKVHGQDAAIRRVCEAVQKSAAGLAESGRPLGSFLFVGRTGTGKTELSRRLASELAREDSDGAANLIRIDCSEYALAHEYSKLIGSPPGYIGHEEGGQFTRALAQKPGAVVLFDEIEKAHPRMHNLLLQILEEGCLTDGRGKRIQLDSNFILMTSNAGAEEIRSAGRALGFQGQEAIGEETLHDLSRRALEELFSPEFLGRVDEVVLFAELGPAAAREIALDQLLKLAIRARRRGIRVAFTPAVARWVVERGFSNESGARELRTVIQREIEPRLACLLLGGTVGEEDLVRVRVRGGEVSFQVEP